MVDKHIYSAATLSWIDPRSGLPEVDVGGEPKNLIDRSVITGESAYRFANFMEVQITTDNGRLISAEFTKNSKMHRGPSFANIPSAQVGEIGRTQTRTEDGSEIILKQVVGCRTISPEMLGTVVGGAYPIFGPIIGRKIAQLMSAFPPIWSELIMKISTGTDTILTPDFGTSTSTGPFVDTMALVLRHSLFPSLSFYRLGLDSGTYDRIHSYDGVPSLDMWLSRGWGGMPGERSSAIGPTPGNPWSMTAPSTWRESRLDQQPAGY